MALGDFSEVPYTIIPGNYVHLNILRGSSRPQASNVEFTSLININRTFSCNSTRSLLISADLSRALRFVCRWPEERSIGRKHIPSSSINQIGALIQDHVYTYHKRQPKAYWPSPYWPVIILFCTSQCNLALLSRFALSAKITFIVHMVL